MCNPTSVDGGGYGIASGAAANSQGIPETAAQNVHGGNVKHAGDKGKTIIASGGPSSINQIVSTGSIQQNRPLSFVSNSPSQPDGTHGAVLVSEAHTEKKRRREGDRADTEEQLLVGFTINTNPLAGSAVVNNNEHFLSAGPGNQACREQ